jgi:hypothetical protein
MYNKKLQYFKNKVCTILTGPTTRFFDETQHTNVFVGFVEEIDSDGVWIIQLSTNRKSFFPMNALIGIIEEVVTPLTEEESRLVRQQVEKRLPEKAPQQLISVDSLKQLKRDTNK